MISKNNKIAILYVIVVLMITSLCSCGKDNGPSKGTYHLITDSGVDKNSYIEVLNESTMVFTNVDATEFIEAIIQAAEQINGSVTMPDPQTGENKEIVIAEASTDEINEFRVFMKMNFTGERKYKVVDRDDIKELYFDDGEMPIGEFTANDNTIIISGKSYKCT